MGRPSHEKSDAVPLKESLLDEESKTFASWLFAWQPSWKEIAKMEKLPSGEFSLYVQLESPTGDPERSLELKIAEGPSFFFNIWHYHLDVLGSDPDADLNEAILEFKRLVSGILSDNLVLLLDHSIEYWSELIVYGNQDELAEIITQPGSGNSFEILSFNGSKDRTFTTRSK